MTSKTNGNKNAKPNIQLTDSVIQILKKKEGLQCTGALAHLFDRSIYTIQDWIRANDPMLCRHDALQVISAHLGFEFDDLIEYPNGVSLMQGV